jgi:ABC-2 type transport system ATP-binding protein
LTSAVGSSQAEVAITVRGLVKHFGKVRALDGVDLDVPSGTVLGLLGPNGAGKTTLVRVLTTLLTPDSGTASVAGLDVREDAAALRHRIGLAGQYAAIDENLTGLENLTMVGRLYGFPRAQAKRRGRELLDRFELDEAGGRQASTYSGGMRRRLDLAAALVAKPEVLFLDEPTTGLDPQNRANLWDHIRALRDRGTTVFLTTHYLEEADVLCDQLVIMDHGQIVAKGTPRDLKRQVAGDSVVITVKDDDTARRAVQLLGEETSVREATAEDDQVRLYVEDSSAALAQLLRLLDREGIGLRSMSVSEPTLDDVFLRQTGRSLRDAGGTNAGKETAA